MNNSKGNIGPPGKLKHNLHNLDVFALLPGAGRPPKKDVVSQAPQITIKVPQRSISLDSEKQVKDEVEGTQNGSSTEDVEVLECITKTRVRGPVKRKPSTKKGREALRKSCIDLTFSMNPAAEDSENEPSQEDNTMKNQSFRNELQAKLLHPPKSLVKQAEYASVEKKPPLRNTMIRHYLKEEHREDTILPTDSANSKQTDLSGHDICYGVPKVVVADLNISHSHGNNKEFGTNEDVDIRNYINGNKTVKVERKHEDTRTYTEISSSIFRKIEPSDFDQHKQIDATTVERSSYRSEAMFRFGQRNDVESSSTASRRSFMNDLVSQEDIPRKSESVHESSLLKRMTFISAMISKQNQSEDGIIDKKVEQTERTNEGVDTENKHSFLEPRTLEKIPKVITPDVNIKNEDRRIRSSRSNGSNPNSENESNFLSVGIENSAHADVGRRSSFIETDNFASPVFIKEDNLSDEDNEDVFSEKKLPPRSDILKCSTLVDDEDEELLVKVVPDELQAEESTVKEVNVKTVI